MHNYELVIIIHPDLDEEAINQALDKIKDWITKAGGTIEKLDNWGKRICLMKFRNRMRAFTIYSTLHANCCSCRTGEEHNNS